MNRCDSSLPQTVECHPVCKYISHIRQKQQPKNYVPFDNLPTHHLAPHRLQERSASRVRGDYHEADADCSLALLTEGRPGLRTPNLIR